MTILAFLIQLPLIYYLLGDKVYMTRKMGSQPGDSSTKV